MKTFAFSIVAALFAFGFLAGTCQADLIVEYLGQNGTTQPSINGLAATGQDLARGAGINQASGGNFNSNGFSTSSTTLADAIAADDYLTFGFNVNSGSSIDMTDIIVEMDRSGTGPSTVYLLYDADGGGFDPGDLLQTESIPDPGALLTFNTGLPSGLTSGSGLVEFRFYYSGATSGSGTSDIEDDLIGGNIGLQLNGSISSIVIPEPGTLGIAGLILAGGLLRRRH